jgi:hypothetical protein
MLGVSELGAAGASAAALRGLRVAGLRAAVLRAAGFFAAAALRVAGLRAAVLRAAGLRAAVLRAAGFFAAAARRVAGFFAAARFGAAFFAAVARFGAAFRVAGFFAAVLRAEGFLFAGAFLVAARIAIGCARVSAASAFASRAARMASTAAGTSFVMDTCTNSFLMRVLLRRHIPAGRGWAVAATSGRPACRAGTRDCERRAATTQRAIVGNRSPASRLPGDASTTGVVLACVRSMDRPSLSRTLQMRDRMCESDCICIRNITLCESCAVLSTKSNRRARFSCASIAINTPQDASATRARRADHSAARADAAP